MPRVDFYIVARREPDARHQTACRLAERAWKAGHFVFVCVADRPSAERLDDMLWTFRQDSFVPHAQLRADPGQSPPSEPVLIGTDAAIPTNADVLINLGEDVPLAFTEFARVAEIVAADDEAKQQGRERYRYYRDHGCEVHTHNL